MRKEVRDLAKTATAKGLVLRNGSRHTKVYGSDGLVTILPRCSKTTGRFGGRNLKQAEIAIRKAKP